MFNLFKKFNKFEFKDIYKRTIYIVPTPIGNIFDISFRSLFILNKVNLILSENTIRANKLLKNFSIKTKTISLNDFNEKLKINYLIEFLNKNKSIAIISNAGTPLINDPGHKLINLAIKNNILIIPLPGPCSSITALSASGLNSSKFCYEGFIPNKQSIRKNYFLSLKYEKRTLIFNETAIRLINSLKDMVLVFNKFKKIVLIKELTKKWEYIHRSTLYELLNWTLNNKEKIKGEMILILEGNNCLDYIDNYELNKLNNIFKLLNNELSNNKSIRIMSKIFNIRKNILYKKFIINK